MLGQFVITFVLLLAFKFVPLTAGNYEVEHRTVLCLAFKLASLTAYRASLMAGLELCLAFKLVSLTADIYAATNCGLL